MHMRDRPFAYEAAGIDQPKSATTPGVLLRALLFSARRGRGCRGWFALFVGGGWVEKSMVEAAGGGGGAGKRGEGEG